MRRQGSRSRRAFDLDPHCEQEFGRRGTGCSKLYQLCTESNSYPRGCRQGWDHPVLCLCAISQPLHLAGGFVAQVAPRILWEEIVALGIASDKSFLPLLMVGLSEKR